MPVTPYANNRWPQPIEGYKSTSPFTERTGRTLLEMFYDFRQWLTDHVVPEHEAEMKKIIEATNAAIKRITELMQDGDNAYTLILEIKEQFDGMVEDATRINTEIQEAFVTIKAYVDNMFPEITLYNMTQLKADR